MKFAAIVFSILLFINGILLSFQYHVFSTKSTDEEKAYTYSQDIEVSYTGKSFKVKQTFTNLPEDAIQISWPEKSKGKSCVKDEEGKLDKASCARLDKNLNSFKKGTKTKQVITYKIPLGKAGIKEGKLYTDLFANLKNGIVSNTTIQITDEKRKGGHWFTGLPKLGEKYMNLVDYAYFSGSGNVYELYWTNQQMKKVFDGKEFSIYTKKFTPTNFTSTLSSMKVLEGGHIDILESSKKANGTRILFTENMKQSALQEKVIVSQIKEQYQFSNDKGDLPILLASFKLDKLLGDAKDKQIVKVLNEYFNKEQLISWNQGLEDLKGETVDATKLDNLLSETLNDKTSYFKLNEASGETVVPLLFEETRDLYLDGRILTDVKIILNGGEILYAANPMLSHLGYKASVGKNGYYVEKSQRKLRFPNEKYDFYVDNEIRNNFNGTRPIVEVGGTYYIEESWMIRIFHLMPPDSGNDRITFSTKE